VWQIPAQWIDENLSKTKQKELNDSYPSPPKQDFSTGVEGENLWPKGGGVVKQLTKGEEKMFKKYE